MAELKYQNTRIADLVALQIGSVGENIATRRGAGLRADKNGHIGYYIHSPCMMIKFNNMS